MSASIYTLNILLDKFYNLSVRPTEACDWRIIKDLHFISYTELFPSVSCRMSG